MNLCRLKFLSAVSLLLSLCTATCAQISVWSNSSVAPKATSAKNKVQHLKDHIQKWGLDTSYNHAFLLGGKLNSDGWSGSIYFTKRKGHTASKIWQICFSEVKHEKQTKQQGTNDGYKQLGNPSAYVFGKINNLYTLEAGVGRETPLLPAVMEGNLSVSFRYSGGFSLGMLKPYYLKLIYTDYSTQPATAHMEQHAYNRQDSAAFLNTNTILGASVWSKSLNEITLTPGVYADFALAIIPGHSKFFIQTITLGAHGAYYARALPIMADQHALPWTANLYAGLAIGKRWK